MNWIALTVSPLLPSDSLVKDLIEGAVRRRRILGGGGGSDDDDDKTDDSDLDEPGWRITRKIMDRVDSSDWLRSELGYGGLRRMIFDIDKADLEASRSSGEGGHDGRWRFSGSRGPVPTRLSPREAAPERARTSNPNFRKFLDRALLESGVVMRRTEGERVRGGVQRTRGSGGIGIGNGLLLIEDLLTRNANDEDLNDVFLVPVPTWRRTSGGGTPSGNTAKDGNSDDDINSGDEDDESSDEDVGSTE